MSVKAILAGQGSGGTETFEAIYGTTTSAEIEAAYQKGQEIICWYQNFKYTMTFRATSTSHSFGCCAGDTNAKNIRCDNDVWTYGSFALAPKDSPALTGTPTAPTAAAGTNTTQLATTAFVQGKLSLNSSSFDWGSETGTADASWFEALSTAAPSEDWVGKTKSVTLTSAVLGTTTHLIRCIGVDQDGENTVTFQTANCLDNTTVFGSSSALWSDSGCTARTECQNYYNAFPGKDYIKQLTKVTNLNYDRSSTNMGTTNDYIWLPSYDEVGLGSASQAPGGDEYTSGQSTAYSYYSSNDSRIKKNGDSGSASRWWLRSRSLNGESYVGGITDTGSSGSTNSYRYYGTSVYLAPAFAIQCTPGYALYQNGENVTEDVAEVLNVPKVDIGQSVWLQKTWNGLTTLYGNSVWSDGTNIYYSLGSNNQYILDKSTLTWQMKVWNGFTNFSGYGIWTDGDNIYYSVYNGSNLNYVLDKATSTWSEKTWGLPSSKTIEGRDIWSDGTNIYYSNGSYQYVLDKSTSTWSTKTWDNSRNPSGSGVWSDGENLYSSLGSYQYVFNRSTSAWDLKTWNGLTSFRGEYVWTDGDNIYYSDNSNHHYILDKSTSTWNPKTWTGLPADFKGGSYIWSDGNAYYYSYNDAQYVYLPGASVISVTDNDGTKTLSLSGASVITGTATLPVGTSWTGPDEDTGLYTYTVSISELTAEDNVHIAPVIDVTDADTGNAQQDAWDTHYWSETVSGGIKFYAAEQPAVAVQFTWMVVRS